MAPSSKNNTSSPLAALAPLHALAQLVPAASPETKSKSGSGSRSRQEDHESDRASYILLTSLETDAWLVHVGRQDGRWWNGAWRVADVEKLASGDMSSTRVGAFARLVAHTIVQREVSVAHEGDDFRNMKLVLRPHSKKPLSLSLSELDKKDAARFAFDYFAKVAEDAQTHDCRILHGDIRHTDADSDTLTKGPSKRRRTYSPNNSPAPSHAVSQMSQDSHKIRSAGSLHEDDDDAADLPGPSRGSTQRLHGRSTGKRKPPPTQAQKAAERATLAEVQELKAELAKARADAAAAVALAAEREPSGFGGSVDRLRSRAAVPAVPRRPGASLANPNKAARRVTAVEFASDSDE